MRSANLDDLVRILDTRSRAMRLLTYAVDGLAITFGASILFLLAVALLQIDVATTRILVVANGGGLLIALVIAGLRRQHPTRVLLDADRAYGFKELLASGWEFSQEPDDPSATQSGNTYADGFESVVVSRSDEAALGVDPTVVYPAMMPRRTPVFAAVLVGFAVLTILYASGWFDRTQPPIVEAGIMVENTGRRLAERAPDNEELQALSDEIRRLGEQMRRNEIPAEEARRKIEELGTKVEEQFRYLDRTPAIDPERDSADFPDTESTIRRALRSGMSDSQVMEFALRMQSEGKTLPDIVKALDESMPDRPPDANLGLDEGRVRELMDQLNAPREEDAGSDLLSELDDARQTIPQGGGGLTELDQGSGDQIGESGDQGVGQPPEGMGGESPGQMDGQGSGEQAMGQQPGNKPVEDAFADDFANPEGNNPVFRELQGIVTDNTIMDIIIRELPSEATSLLTEEERAVEFSRVVEEAMQREYTPPDLQRLVRNYFLRVTMVAEEGAEDEQQ